MTTPSEPRGAVARHTAYLPHFWDTTKWLRSLSATAFVDEFQQQSAISRLADVHEK
ncbi:hypothetical protein [Streptomyces violaceusniger]|uniref:Uncharacterized protein n=1 Tax=Streptomyces violaceusniger TaxID=68280 RepID=A0A4D4L482_STRVO|nr:hypothetical protein SVIO_040110 [Streptomyces violaceusniger]